MNVQRIARALAVVALLAAAAGCSDSSKSSTSTTTTAPVETKGFQIETPDGQASLSLDGLLPPRWPSGFPVARDAKAAGSGSLGGAQRAALVAVYTTTATPEETYAFYRSNNAYRVVTSSSAGVGAVFAGRITLAGAYPGSVSVASKDSRVYVVVVLDPGPTSTTTTVM